MRMIRVTTMVAALALSYATSVVAADSLSKGELKTAHESIEADFKSAAAACKSLAGNPKDICMAEAKGKEKVAKAELVVRNRPGEKASYDLHVARADAAYGIAKEKCDDRTGNDKTACVKEAKAEEARAKADAKAHMKTAAAGKTAPEASKSESAGEYVEDALITTKVKAAVLQEGTLKSAEINVETLKGTVQLSGFVRSRDDINKAVEVARGVKGVKSVKNDMILKTAQ